MKTIPPKKDNSTTNEDIVSRRMLKIEQRKNRLTQEQAMLKTKLRKMRTRRLIELGGLVSKAKLEGWSAVRQDKPGASSGCNSHPGKGQAYPPGIESWAYGGNDMS